MHVELSALDREGAAALLRRHHVGRMAFTHHDHVTIRLVNYVFADGWIYARMATADGVQTLRHNQWVAFEVDEVDGIYDWRTVTVHGSAHFLDEGEIPGNEYTEAVRLLRSVVPSVLTPDDPLPERAHVYRVHVDEIVSLDARSDSPAALPPA
jgi:nitroimidazol reductase NimA-like FMN-containing flavoprotein (pyridoxamine 5'-phosphate oxidase superfamily)